MSLAVKAAPPKSDATVQCLLRLACAEVADKWKGPAGGSGGLYQRGHPNRPNQPEYLNWVVGHGLEAAQQDRLDLSTIQALVRLTGTALKVRCSALLALSAAGAGCWEAAGSPPVVWQP